MKNVFFSAVIEVVTAIVFVQLWRTSPRSAVITVSPGGGEVTIYVVSIVDMVSHISLQWVHTSVMVLQITGN